MAACGFVKPDGTRCKALPMKGEGWCYVHHPHYADKRRADGAKGGKRGGRGRPLSEVARIQSRLEELAEGVLDSSVDKSKASIAAQIYNFALRAVSVGLKAKEQEELVARLETLEEQLERNKGSGLGYGA